METRSLLPEIDEAKFGAAAQVRTRFGRGSGLVLPAEHEVLAHLHVVLTQKKKIADPIFVNLSGSSNRTKDELHAYVVAQDPTHDLVLLKIGTAPVSSRPDPQGGPSAKQKAPQEEHHRPAHPARRRRSSRADPSGSPHNASTKKKTHSVKTHVVYDGPASSDDDDSQELNR